MKPDDNNSRKTSRPTVRALKKQSKKFERTKYEVIDEDLRVAIFQIAQSPNWYIQYNDPVKGQRKPSLRTRNVKEARRRAWEIVQKLRKGELNATSVLGPKISEACEAFIANKRRRGGRETSITGQRRSLIQFQLFCASQGVARLGHVTPTIMSIFEQKLRSGGIELPTKIKERTRYAKLNKGRTVHEKIKLVKGLTKFATAWKLIRENPIAQYELPPRGKANVHCYTPEEVVAICAHAAPFFGDVFAFLAYTGLRQGELRWLTKQDLLIGQRALQIRAKEFPDLGLRWDPKTDSRVVPLCDPAFEIAKKMFDTRAGRWLFPAPAAPQAKDDRLRSSRLSDQLDRDKLAAGVARGTLHSFRHFFVSTMANANVSPFKVMKIVGHKSLDIILTYYHVTDGELLSAVQEVNFRTIVPLPKEAS